MAASGGGSRGLFSEAARAVLGSWPVLQIAVENGFGGPHCQEKAEWIVGAIDQYFSANADLEQYEVEDTLQGMMNDEFDTIVEDGSLSLVAQQLCVLYSQCRSGETVAVQEKIAQLAQKKYDVRANVQEVKADDQESSEEELEGMDCETPTSSSSAVSMSVSSAPCPAPKEEEEEPEVDGWTVVRRKKK